MCSHDGVNLDTRCKKCHHTTPMKQKIEGGKRTKEETEKLELMNKLIEFTYGNKKQQERSRKVWEMMKLEMESNPLGIIKTYWKK